MCQRGCARLNVFAWICSYECAMCSVGRVRVYGLIWMCSFDGVRVYAFAVLCSFVCVRVAVFVYMCPVGRVR